nr:MAG TPA: hypothetical protein [Caudoviricetes sp.]
MAGHPPGSLSTMRNRRAFLNFTEESTHAKRR